MGDTTTTDRKATATEVRVHAQTLRDLAAQTGLETPRLRDDGTIVVRSPEAGYRRVLEFAGHGATVVGTYVHVITDDAPAARATSDL